MEVSGLCAVRPAGSWPASTFVLTYSAVCSPAWLPCPPALPARMSHIPRSCTVPQSELTSGRDKFTRQVPASCEGVSANRQSQPPETQFVDPAAHFASQPTPERKKKILLNYLKWRGFSSLFQDQANRDISVSASVAVRHRSKSVAIGSFRASCPFSPVGSARRRQRPRAPPSPRIFIHFAEPRLGQPEPSAQNACVLPTWARRKPAVLKSH